MTGRNGSTAIPSAVDAERSLLGAAMLSASVREVLVTTVKPEDFAQPRHSAIAAALIDAERRGAVVDAVTLHQDLQRSGDDVELVDLIELSSAAVSLAGPHARRYAELILEAATGRRLIGLAEELRDAGYKGGDAARDIATRVAGELGEITASPAGREAQFEDVASALNGEALVQPAMLVRSDGQRLLYAGAINGLQAEPSTGKTTVAGVAAVQVLEAGGHVMYLDYEDILPRLAVRLLALDAARDHLIDRFHYMRPGPLADADCAGLVAAAERLNVDLVVIDGVTEALTAQNLDEEKGHEIAQWMAMLPRPLAATGAAVLLIDHVTKSKEHRGRWARGSGHKLAAIDGAAYALDAVIPFSRQRAGRLTLTIAKDRSGAVGSTGDTAAVIHANPIADGQRLVVTIEPSLFVDDDGAPKSEPIITDELRQAALESIARLTRGVTSVSRNEILNDVRATGLTFRDKNLGVCLARLWQDGEVHREKGPNRSHLYSLPAHQPTLDETEA